VSATSSGPSPVHTLSAAPPALTTETAAVHVLVVDDEPALRRSLARVLETRGMRVGVAEDGGQALEYIQRTPPDVALVDMMMPGIGGLEVLSRVKAMGIPIEVLLMTAFADVDAAVAAMKAGAYHFLTKPFHSNDAVAHAVFKAAEHRRLADRARQLEQVLLSKERFGEIIGDSPKMLDVFRLIEGVAPTSSTVLILGESGTGKELVARAIHQHSPRAKRSFVAVNCGAIPKELVESELFGHVRGAFTGATDTRPGLFEYANGGTVFLDEVGETSLAMQAKLLRVIQNREIQRVGSPEVKQVNVRLIAATNRDLRAEVLSGRFREDLFYRLSSIQIRIPSLAERLEDIPLLVQFFLKKYNDSYGKNIAGLTRRAQTVLLQHPWPGNVRELENVISTACITATGDFIDISDLPEHLQHHNTRIAGDEDWRPLSLEEVRKVHIQKVLQMCNGNRLRAAQILGIGRTSLYRYLKRDGYDVRPHSASAGAAA